MIFTEKESGADQSIKGKLTKISVALTTRRANVGRSFSATIVVSILELHEAWACTKLESQNSFLQSIPMPVFGEIMLRQATLNTAI